MSFRVAEQFVAGKFDDPDRCEDIIHVSDAYYGVIDGATLGPRTTGKTPGKIIAEATASALAACPPDMAMPDAIRHINAHVRKELGYRDSADVLQRGPRPAASCGFLSVARDEIWAVGDILLMLDGKELDLTKKIDHATTLYRCAMVAAMLSEGTSVETLLTDAPDQAHVKPLLDKQQACFLNRAEQKDFGYANIDGADEVISLIKIIPVAGVREIIMASDGYPVLHATLKKSEDALAHVIGTEPTMHSISPQVKGMRKGLASFDDRAYLRLIRQ